MADEALPLSGRGVPAYLDGAGIVRLARAAGCDSIHPGYGFLAENAAFARACEEGGLRFVGPAVETLELFGDKLRARAAALAHDVPVLPGTDAPTSVAQATAFFEGLPAGSAMMIKAVAGGGGRGTRVISSADQIAATFERCRSEAEGAFGDGTLYVEQMVTRARHVEVQILGDGTEVVQVGERECSAQRRHQKLVEIAPAPGLPGALRTRVIDAARRMAAAVGYRSLGTFEFLGGRGRRGRRCRVLLCRGQPPAAGGAHGYRGGYRPRPGAGAARHRRRPVAGGARAHAGADPRLHAASRSRRA